MSCFIGNSTASIGLSAATSGPSFMGLSLYDDGKTGVQDGKTDVQPVENFAPISDYNFGFQRPSLWGEPRNYFNLPSLIADPEWMSPGYDLSLGLPGPSLRFNFLDDDFTLPTLGEAYQIWQSGQYYGSSKYSLWPTNPDSDDFSTPQESGGTQSPIQFDSSSENLFDVSTLPANLDDLLNFGETTEVPLEEEFLPDENYGSSSGCGYQSPKKVCHEAQAQSEIPDTIPVVSKMPSARLVFSPIQEASVQSESADSIDVVEVAREQVLTTVESGNTRMLMGTPQTEVVSAASESLTASVTAFVLPEMGSNGWLSYFSSGIVFLNVAGVDTETSPNIFTHEISSVDLEANQATFGELPVVLDEAQIGVSGFSWQQGSHLSTVSLTVQPKPFDLSDRRREGSSESSGFFENGARHFQFSGNLNPRVTEREVYLHSGMMLVQTSNRGFFGAHREEALFLQQASRRLHTVSQNDSKDHGGGNPNSRAREIYQMALDEDSDAVKISSESEDEIDWQPHPQVVVDTVLV